jgi:hypothetical protein
MDTPTNETETGLTASQSTNATVNFSDQPSTGESVLVSNVTLPEGGFVVIHDESLLEGDVTESVIGASEFLDAGTHENVRIEFDEPIGNGTVIAMPHRDTDNDENFRFVETDGSVDGPYTVNETAVTDPANVTIQETATVAIGNQSASQSEVSVNSTFLPTGGFVAVYDSTRAEAANSTGFVGATDFLDAGYHEHVPVSLTRSLGPDQTVVAIPHTDTDGDREFTFVRSGGAADGPYTVTDEPVFDTAGVTSEGAVMEEPETTTEASMTNATTTMGTPETTTTVVGAEENSTATATTTTSTNAVGPGFTAVGVFSAFAAVALGLLARRRR